MPNRIIKESICTSDSIDTLSWFEEVLFYRLIVNCDDYGRFDGRMAVIKNRLFPLKNNVTAKTVEQSINKLVTVGLVTLYVFEGKPYLQLPTWEKHQTVRAKKSKYPPFDTDLQADEIICMQMQANVPVIQSNTNTNPNTYTTTTTKAPPFHEVHEYFKREAVFKADVNFADETLKFIAYNKKRGWDCLPDWKAAADLWAVRTDEK